MVTNGWCAYFFRLYALVICDHAPAQRNVEDSDFVSAVPHNNHHTVGTARWQNHDSSPPQSVIYTALSCSSRSIKPLHFLHNTFTRPWISPSCSGAGVKQWLQMIGALFIAYNALRMKIRVLSHPQNYIDPKHKMSRCIRFPTIRYVRPAKPQINLRIRAV